MVETEIMQSLLLRIIGIALSLSMRQIKANVQHCSDLERALWYAVYFCGAVVSSSVPLGRHHPNIRSVRRSSSRAYHRVYLVLGRKSWKLA